MTDKRRVVSKEFLNNYVDNWVEKKELPSNVSLIYCEDGNKYIGVDNTTNDCWVEEFESEKDVLNWLSGIEKETIFPKSKNDGRDVR